MSIVLTTEQSQSLKRGDPIRVTNPDTGEDVVVLRGTDYEAICEMLEEERARQAIANVAVQTAAHWAQENPH